MEGIVVLATYTCEVCGQGYSDEAIADQCEKQGKPEFKYPIGWGISEYDGDFYVFVVEQKVSNEGGKHVPTYGLFFDDDWASHRIDSIPEGAHVSTYVSEFFLNSKAAQGYY